MAHDPERALPPPVPPDAADFVPPASLPAAPPDPPPDPLDPAVLDPLPPSDPPSDPVLPPAPEDPDSPPLLAAPSAAGLPADDAPDFFFVSRLSVR